MLDFPQYRKYKNNLSFFEIVSNELFFEWKKTGTSWEKRWSVSIMMTIVRENGQLQLQLISVEDIIMFIVDKDFIF